MPLMDQIEKLMSYDRDDAPKKRLALLQVCWGAPEA